MIFQRKGRLFNLSDYTLPDGCVGYAQSPQALELEDRVRIFFSTRSRDKVGKFISHVCFVDVSRDFEQVLFISERPVISPGELGAFDEHGIFPLNPVRHKNRLLGFTTGWSRRISVSVETGIGLVESKDFGLNFHRLGVGPVMSSTIDDPCLVGDGYVISKDGNLHMWYIRGKGWRRASPEVEPDRIYKIAYAFSVDDGKNWHRQNTGQLIDNCLDEDECQALPTVIELDGLFHMIFCFREAFGFRENKENGYRLGYAYSSDMVSWTRDDSRLQFIGDQEDWERDMQCYPNLVRVENELYLLYNGNKFGSDGFGFAKLIA